MNHNKKVISKNEIIQISKDILSHFSIEKKEFEDSTYHRIVELIIHIYMRHIKHIGILFRDENFFPRTIQGFENIFIFNEDNNLRLSLFEVKSYEPLIVKTLKKQSFKSILNEHSTNKDSFKFDISNNISNNKCKLKEAFISTINTKNNETREQQIDYIYRIEYGYKEANGKKCLTSRNKDYYIKCLGLENMEINDKLLYDDFIFLKENNFLKNVFFGTVSSNASHEIKVFDEFLKKSNISLEKVTSIIIEEKSSDYYDLFMEIYEQLK